MPSAPIPADERSRIALLRELDVLDTLPERYSESIAATAAAIANTPIAAISLVDAERQWFKGSCGLDVQQTSRSVSFCAHAILGSAPLLIADARTDARFKDNALVLGEPNVRFYAGFPLVVRDRTIGALCVIDDRVRELTPAQIRRLTDLAGATSAWLEMRTSSTRP